MKNKLLITFFAISAFVSAQKIDFGVKGGAVFNTDKGRVFSDINNIYKEKGKGATGFQAGVLARISLVGLYIQPEVLYTQFKNEYDVDNNSLKVTKKRIDVPVNVGKKFLGIAHVQAGPVFSYYLNDGISLNDVKKLKQDDFNVGFQVGTGVKVSNILVDLRYEHGFGKMTSKFIGSETAFKTQSRASILNLSVGYLF